MLSLLLLFSRPFQRLVEQTSLHGKRGSHHFIVAAPSRICVQPTGRNLARLNSICHPRHNWAASVQVAQLLSSRRKFGGATSHVYNSIKSRPTRAKLHLACDFHLNLKHFHSLPIQFADYFAQPSPELTRNLLSLCALHLHFGPLNSETR